MTTKTLKLTGVCIWRDGDRILFRSDDSQSIASVNNDPNSVNFHRKLYKLFNQFLKKSGR